MRFLLSSSVVLPAISAFLSLMLILYCWTKGKKSPLLLSFIACQVMIFIWSLGQALELMALNDSGKWIFIKIEYFAICFSGLCWFVFCLLFTERNHIFNKKALWFLGIIPVINYLVVLTNDLHYRFQIIEGEDRLRGVFFWIIVSMTYIYALAGVILLVKYSKKQYGNTKRQTFLFIAAVVIPLTFNFLYVSGLSGLKTDITPMSFCFSFLVFALATFKYRFLDVMPIARKKIVDNMNDAIFVVNRLDRIIDWNDSFFESFMKERGVEKNDDIRVFTGRLKELNISSSQDEIIRKMELSRTEKLTGELTVDLSSKKTYYFTIQPVVDKQGELLARIFTFNDVTEYKKLLEELNDKNHELSVMNEELAKYAATAEELAVAKERNRFAHDVHDTLGHTMTLLISILEVANITYKSDSETTGEKIKEAIKTAKEGMKELRRSITGLVPEKLSSNNFLTSLKNLFADFRLSGVDIEFNVEGKEPVNIKFYSDVLYRICQEALTNSIRHGKAKNVNIIMRFNINKIQLFIFDDGIGCKDIKKGFGLTGMDDRLKSLNGTISYGSDGESGFNIRVEIPIINTGVDNHG